jgi:sulfate transport system ATP-binding protein
MGWEIEAELQLEDGHQIKAILTRERFDQLELKAEQRVYIKSKEAKSFPLRNEVVGSRA